MERWGRVERWLRGARAALASAFLPCLAPVLGFALLSCLAPALAEPPAQPSTAEPGGPSVRAGSGTASGAPGPGIASVTPASTVPAKPTNLRAGETVCEIGASCATAFRWDNQASNAQWNQIRWKCTHSSCGFSNWIYIAESHEFDSQNLRLTGAREGHTYDVEVMSANDDFNCFAQGFPSGCTGQGEVSDTLHFTVPPFAPTNLAFSQSDSEDLTWTDPSGIEEGFRIVVSKCDDAGENCAPFKQDQTLAANTTSATVAGLEANATYSITVRAWTSAGGASVDSNAVLVAKYDPPAAPGGFRRCTSGDEGCTFTSTSATFKWSDLSANEFGFEVDYRIQGNTVWTTSERLAPGTETLTLTDAFTAGTTWEARVRAVNPGGEAASRTLTFRMPPAAPTGLSTSVRGTNWVTLTWNDTVYETGYRIFKRMTADESWAEAGTTLADVTSIRVGDLTPGAHYAFVARAFNEVGESVDSDQLEVSAPGVRPPAPTGVTLTARTSAAFTLNWADGGWEDGYRVYVRQRTDYRGDNWGPTPTFSAWTLAGTLPRDATTLTVTGLADDNWYATVRAFNGVGESADSDHVVVLATNAPRNFRHCRKERWTSTEIWFCWEHDDTDDATPDGGSRPRFGVWRMGLELAGTL